MFEMHVQTYVANTEEEIHMIHFETAPKGRVILGCPENMKKDAALKGRVVLALLGCIICMLSLWGCGGSEKANGKGEEISENGESADTESFDRYDLELDYNAYEKDYATELLIENEPLPIEIWRSAAGYQVIKIGDQEIPYEHREIPLGGAGLVTMAYDFTDDGKEEVVFLESSGASGAYQYILVFTDIDGQWEEMKLPSDLYSDEDSAFLKKQCEELDMETGESVYAAYRTISFDEEKMIIRYGLYTDTVSGPVETGTIQRELHYASDEKSFVQGDIRFIPAGN